MAIDPNAPETVWAGTGEANPRNSISVGGGVFKTTDGGKAWQFLALEKTTTSTSAPAPRTSSSTRRTQTLRRDVGRRRALEALRRSRRHAERQPRTHRPGLSRSNPNIVYARVEADKSALLRSDDGGVRWKSVNTETDIAPRPFYSIAARRGGSSALSRSEDEGSPERSRECVDTSLPWHGRKSTKPHRPFR
ncbi:MAG TPA: hypothetical protein VLU46_08715 [Thermoanaerobaculia bacterium]|nr:hypothetical protein [Thermoanaerobaculia bacterium]